MEENESRRELLDSPDAMDRYIRVVSPGVWITLAVIIALLLSALIWGIFGSVDIVDASGNIQNVRPITLVTN